MITLEYLRSFKLGEYAIFDLASSFLGIWLLLPLLKWLFRFVKLDIPLSSWILFTLPIGIVIHALVGNATPMTKYFLDPTGHYILKAFIILLLFLGFRRIKLVK